MNNSTISDINSPVTINANNISENSVKNSNKKKFKQIWQLGNKYLVVLDESIIQKLGITNDSTFFVEQEITNDNTAIMMRINKLQIGGA